MNAGDRVTIWTNAGDFAGEVTLFTDTWVHIKFKNADFKMQKIHIRTGAIIAYSITKENENA